MPPKGHLKGQPVTLSGDVFYDNNSLMQDQLEDLRFSSSSDFIKETIQWNGGLLGMTTLSLSNDNPLLEDSSVVLFGGIFYKGPKVFTSLRFFDITLLKFLVYEIDATALNFENSCISEFVDASILNYEFKESIAGAALNKHDLKKIPISLCERVSKTEMYSVLYVDMSKLKIC